jgi:hypothetical protein
MMHITAKANFLELTSGEGRMIARATNRGEPYREGADVTLYLGEYYHLASVFLEDTEAIALRDFLLRIYPVEKHPVTKLL